MTALETVSTLLHWMAQERVYVASGQWHNVDLGGYRGVTVLLAVRQPAGDLQEIHVLLSAPGRLGWMTYDRPSEWPHHIDDGRGSPAEVLDMLATPEIDHVHVRLETGVCGCTAEYERYRVYPRPEAPSASAPTCVPVPLQMVAEDFLDPRDDITVFVPLD